MKTTLNSKKRIQSVRTACVFAVVLAACTAFSQTTPVRDTRGLTTRPIATSPADNPLAWPVASRKSRPWAYGWWMGSVVDKTNLTRELQRYHDAGYGGVHIIPIYGAKGWEDKYISYLNPRWMEMLAHTVSEAQWLDLGIDMTTGTGWCFGGGTNVSEREGNASVVVKTFNTPAGAFQRRRNHDGRYETNELIDLYPEMARAYGDDDFETQKKTRTIARSPRHSTH